MISGKTLTAAAIVDIGDRELMTSPLFAADTGWYSSEDQYRFAISAQGNSLAKRGDEILLDELGFFLAELFVFDLTHSFSIVFERERNLFR